MVVDLLHLRRHVIERCSIGGVGDAYIHHSTIAESDRTRASDVDTRLVRHSQVASQGTGAVNVRDADKAIYGLFTSTSTSQGLPECAER
jgi:hypothetical protein